MSVCCAFNLHAVTTLYVSTKGEDLAPGTKEKPFATIFRARDEIRRLKAYGKLPAGGMVVEIAGGRYTLDKAFELTEKDSGTASAPITYRCAPGARPWFFGGKELPVSAFQPLTDADLLARIPKKAHANIRCLDLNKAGIKYYTRLPDRFNDSMSRPSEKLGFKPEYGYQPRSWDPLEIFSDGVAMHPARWPNQGFVNVDEVLDEGEGFGSANIKGGKFAQPTLKTKLKYWAGAKELILHGYFYRDYFSFSARVEEIDLEKSTVKLTKGQLDKKSKPHQRFYAHHLPEELDSPGEWYLDRDKGVLCIFPPEGARNILLSNISQSVFLLNKASHIGIQGVGVEGGRRHGFEINSGLSNSIVACEIRNIGGNGVAISKGTDNQVLGCDIHHTGRGGIRLDGGDRKTLVPGNNVAENNHIYHTSRLIRNYTVPIALSGVGNRASRNLIHDIPHIAFHFRGNDHIMELNEIFSILEETNEAGIFYTGRDWTSRGNIIRYNFMHHSTGVPSWGVRFVHLDDSASGCRIYGNICYKLEDGIAICGGNDNHIKDNLFVKCKETINLSSRGIEMFKSDGKGGFIFDDEVKGWSSLTKYLRRCKWSEPPYSTKYPKLKALFTKNPIAAPWWNEIERNIAVDCKKHISATSKSAEWECTVENNWVTDDPGFVDPEHKDLNFRFKPDAEAFSKIGFKAAPIDEIGIYEAKERASWPVVCERPPKEWKPRWILSRDAMSRSPIRVFPVADIKEGRKIVIDGAVNDEEWSPPGYDGSDPKRHGAAVIENLLNGSKDPAPCTAYIETDGSALLVAFLCEVDAGQPVSRTHRWGRDDAVEISLAVADLPEKTPGGEIPYIFRGFSDGHFEGSTESGWSEQDVEQSMKGVEFGAASKRAGKWTAEFRIPFANFGLHNPQVANRPILINLTVHKAAQKSWVQWKNPSERSWNVAGGQALWLKPFGALPYLPGCRPSSVRIDIIPASSMPEKTLLAVDGAYVPGWAKNGNRIIAEHGGVRDISGQSTAFSSPPRLMLNLIFS